LVCRRRGLDNGSGAEHREQEDDGFDFHALTLTAFAASVTHRMLAYAPRGGRQTTSGNQIHPKQDPPPTHRGWVRCYELLSSPLSGRVCRRRAAPSRTLAGAWPYSAG
jgi:hypothetical protein